MPTEILDESFFAGNNAAFADLRDALGRETFLAFTGAGTSAPALPTWTASLRHLLDFALERGAITGAEKLELEGQVAVDPLEVANSLEDALTKTRFRARIVKLFGKTDLLTPQHELIMSLPFSGFVTLNFDQGLQNAYVQRFKAVPEVIKPQNTYQLAKWTQRETLRIDTPPILQWHGSTSDPENMIFTADDYNQFYAHNENVGFIRDMWRSHRIFAIGFGSTDPFLTRVLEQTLRGFDTDNRHFALVGYKGDEPTTPLSRRTFTKKFRLTPIFYHVRVNKDGSEDHSDLNLLLKSLVSSDEPPAGAIDDNAEYSDTLDFSASEGRREFERDLLTSTSGKQLYVEPRLYKPQPLSNDGETAVHETVSVNDIVRSTSSYVISAPHEYGLTNLGKRLFVELNKAKNPAYLRDATTLPDYRKKLEQDDAFSTPYKNDAVLILDNVNLREHERLIKEIVGVKRFARVIFLARVYETSSDGKITYNGDDALVITLNNLERSDIRSLASQMYSSSDNDLLSNVVEKTYNDLLELCIPLTPANVVMYLTIVYKEGDFVPLNRLQIIDKYLRDLLRRPSDPFRDSFNVDNKLDVIAGFVSDLFKSDNVTFSAASWCTFCTQYMANSLVSFDEAALLSDLASSRMLTRIRGGYRFNYKLFYNFFLGRYVANRPVVLQEFIAANEHMRLHGLVEVISAISSDNTNLVTDLCSKLEDAVAAFRTAYGLEGLDPVAEIEWMYDEEEEKRTWSAVTERLSAGPADTAEIDAVKRSILAERRTENQDVVIRDFALNEQDIMRNQIALRDAIGNAVDIDGKLKVRAIMAIHSAYLIAYQIGIVFSPLIAGNRYFMWNGIGFQNGFNYVGDEVDNIDRQIALIVSALPVAVLERATSDLGSRKLGEVHRHIAMSGKLLSFDNLLNFALLLRSKPLGWENTAVDVIAAADKKALYLRYMLHAALHQFHEEVNTNHERSQLKKIVATIHAKRELKKALPGNRAISDFLRRMDKTGFFEKKNETISASTAEDKGATA